MNSLLYLIDTQQAPSHLNPICKCGWLLVTNENKTVLQCSNKDCPIHNSHKMSQALKILGIKANIADKRALEMLQYFKLDHHMYIFDPNILFSASSSTFSSSFRTLRLEKSRLDKSKIYLYDFIDAFSIESIGRTRSLLIFSEFTDPDEFYNKYPLNNKDSIKELSSYVADKLKIASYTKTVTDIVDDLTYYKPILTKVGKWFKFQSTYDTTIYVAITGEINKILRENGERFKPRESVGEYWSNKYQVNIIPTNLSKKNVQYLIMDTDMTNNRKFSKAISDGITVMNSKEFDEYLANKNITKNKVKDIGIKIEENEDISNQNLTVEDLKW